MPRPRWQGLERAHAQFLGQGERLAVVSFGLFHLWRHALRRDLTEKPHGIGCVAPFLMRPGELQSPPRLRACLVQAASQQIRLTSQTIRGAWSHM